MYIVCNICCFLKFFPQAFRPPIPGVLVTTIASRRQGPLAFHLSGDAIVIILFRLSYLPGRAGGSMAHTILAYLRPFFRETPQRLNFYELVFNVVDVPDVPVHHNKITLLLNWLAMCTHTGYVC